MAEYIAKDEQEKITKAIAGLREVDKGAYNIFCQGCQCYIMGETVWEYPWISDYDDSEYRCKYCFPTREAIVEWLRMGKKESKRKRK